MGGDVSVEYKQADTDSLAVGFTICCGIVWYSSCVVQIERE
jgi:hypothetical protein